MKVRIPHKFKFSDLELALRPDGSIQFNHEVVEKIIRKSKLTDEDLKRPPADLVSKVILAFYIEHLRRGGDKNELMENQIKELILENSKGQYYSHTPGIL
ncbi:hypothetical protein [Galenea microaerophila]